MKYRIITDGKKFKIQQRILWLFWDSVYYVDEKDYEYEYIFDTKKEAEDKIQELDSGRKWKVVK